MADLARYDPSPASIRPLIDAFWSSQGWRTPPAWPAKPDFEAAVRRGVMFAEPRILDHDGWVHAAKKAAERLTPTQIEDAFLASLTSRRLDLRSALSSYMIATRLPRHVYRAAPRQPICPDCFVTSPEREEDLNVLNFERFKWGGVRRDNIVYAAFDLEQFRLAPRPNATEQDVTLGKQLLDTLRSLPPGTTAPAAAKHLRALKGNKAEREELLDILGICSILQTPQHPGHLTQFVPHWRRDLPPYRYVDRAYPVCWWRSDHGVNTAAVAEVLPRLL